MRYIECYSRLTKFMQTFACSGKLGEEAAVLSETAGNILDEGSKCREDFRNSKARFLFFYFFTAATYVSLLVICLEITLHNCEVKLDL